MADTYEEEMKFATFMQVYKDPKGAWEEIQRLRKERDTFAYRLNRLDETLNEAAGIATTEPEDV